MVEWISHKKQLHSEGGTKNFTLTAPIGHEVLNAYLFEELDQVRQISSQWLRIYNEERPHDTLESGRQRYTASRCRDE